MKNTLIAIAVILPFVGYILFSESFNQTSEQPGPEIETESTELISMTDEKSGITFSYPTDFNYKYVRAIEWPPRFVNSIDPIKCDLDEQTQAMSGATSSTQTFNGNTYCVWETNEGAAGSVYSTYQLTYPKENQYFTMSFTLQYPQCMNYPTDKANECEIEQKEFPINRLIDSIAQSAQLPD